MRIGITLAASLAFAAPAMAQIAPGGGGGGGTPGGTSGQLQYNNSGAFGGYTIGSGLAVSGGALTATGGAGSVTFNTTCPNSTQTGSTLALSGATVPVVVSAASYTLLGTNATPTDCGRPVILTNSGAVAVTLPTEGGVGFADGYVTVVSAQGAGGATITPSTGTINGGASISLVQHQSATIWGAGGAWYASVSTSGGVTGGLNASIPSGNYFYPFMGGITTGQSGVALTTNILYCTEFGQVQSNNITVKGMGAFLSTGVAASHAQFVIYSVAGGTLTYVDSTASQSTASSSVSITGALSNTTDVLLGTNLYALCLNTDTSGLVFSSALAGSPGLVMTTVGTATVGNIASVGAKSIASTFACSSSCTNGFPNTVSLGSMGDFTSKTPTLALQAN